MKKPYVLLCFLADSKSLLPAHLRKPQAQRLRLRLLPFPLRRHQSPSTMTPTFSLAFGLVSTSHPWVGMMWTIACKIGGSALQWAGFSSLA